MGWFSLPPCFLKFFSVYLFPPSVFVRPGKDDHARARVSGLENFSLDATFDDAADDMRSLF